MGNKLNLLGQIFERLTVIREVGTDVGGFVLWECLCVCGNKKTIRSASLRNGTIRSCGCIKHELDLLKLRTHGKSRTPEHGAWIGMKGRCGNPNNSKYHLYGGRGIMVCERWLHSFENFYEDMGKRPSSRHSLDRYPDMNGHYEPGNCRWATIAQQNRNTRANVFITYNGETKPIIDWCEYLGMGKATFLGRIKMGWTVHRIMTTPVQFHKERKKCKR